MQNSYFHGGTIVTQRIGLSNAYNRKVSVKPMLPLSVAYLLGVGLTNETFNTPHLGGLEGVSCLNVNNGVSLTLKTWECQLGCILAITNLIIRTTHYCSAP